MMKIESLTLTAAHPLRLNIGTELVALVKITKSFIQKWYMAFFIDANLPKKNLPKICQNC